MQKIPVEAIPNQTFNITLNEQNCTIHLYQRGDYLYMDLSVDGEVIRQGMICLVDISLLQYTVQGFSGYLYFADMRGMGGTPVYTELGSRYILFYATEEDMANV